MKIGSSMLVGYLRHAYEEGCNTAKRGQAPSLAGERSAITAAAKVCTGMTDEQIIAVASGEASIVGWHHLGMSYVTEGNYEPAKHDGGPIRLREDVL